MRKGLYNEEELEDEALDGSGFADATQEPDEKYYDASASVPSGDDLHKSKRSYKATAGGDNPMNTESAIKSTLRNSDAIITISNTIKTEILSIKNNLNTIVFGGGVSANSYLKNRLDKASKLNNWKVFIPELQYTTDNAAMIGIVGHLKYKDSVKSSLNSTPSPRLTF